MKVSRHGRIALTSTFLLTGILYALAYNISGVVADTDNEPLAGASLRLLRARDSVAVKGAAADNDGKYTIRDIANGKYILEASYIGHNKQFVDIAVNGRSLRADTIRLSDEAYTLDAITVTGIRTPVKVMEDTIEFNADTYKVQPNAVVEDLLKRLPGVEVSSDGKITSNGKEVTKILVDGKEFFSDDPKVASKNLPVNMVDKLQIVDRKSDLARITGVDDGEEETVINLTVKKGMKNGWFGSAEAGIGTDDRYMGSFNVNRFWNDNQITLLGGINNINEPGFTDGASGRFRRFGGDNGITTSRALGLNFNVGNKEIFRVGGDVMYSNTSIRTRSTTDRQYLFADSTSYVNSGKYSYDKGHNVRADFRIQWNPDSLNTLEIRPRMMYNSSDGLSVDSSLTRAGDIDLTRVTQSRNRSTSDGTSWEFGLSVIYNHKFASRPGRSFSVHLEGSTSNVRENEDSYSWNRFFLLDDKTDVYDQFANNHTWNKALSARLSWTEPLGNVRNGNFLTFSYRWSYRWSNADRLTYDRPVSWPGGYDNDPLIGDELVWNQELSNSFRNNYMSQDIRAGFRHVSRLWTIDAGLSVVPQMSSSHDLIDNARDIPTRHTLNIAPYLRYRWKFSKQRTLNLDYRGRSSQPSMSQLQPVADKSDPLRIVVGNPSLDPTFTHNIRLRFQDFNADAQRSIMAMAFANITQNSIVSNTTYDATTGGQTTTYNNVNGVWSAMAMGMYSQPLRNRSFVFNTHLGTRLNHNVGFNNGLRNTSMTFDVMISPSLAWRPENVELELRPRYNFQSTRNSVQSGSNRNVHGYGFSFYGSYYTPFGVVLTTDLSYDATSGYSAGYDRNEWMWNASIAYQFLRDRSATITLKAYDLLHQKSNISRNVTANYIDDSSYNSLTRYFMVTFSYKFNTFGKGNEPQSRNADRRRGPGGPPPGGPRGGRP